METTAHTKLVTRVLPPEEWPEKLAGTSLAQAIYDPDNAFVIVVEDSEGQVVACWSAVNTVHVEGLWIHETWRQRVAVARALLQAMFEELRSLSVTQVITNADTPEIERMLTTIGAIQLPGTSWVIQVKEE